ncbi:uncharacterized protein MONBRDRAFT_31090 [Monosiga brevicollis MX1]|uniref:Glucosidase 2 subunit beta n=1 Tax=Monosiga brevicollis TaxID=81824 RepID=A9URN6_MONBE|nr:uncharacterized protein MONBRDRAFT_31090 [Monosiga brevicollis MX1]EDQ91956.1 predicted protein [Monosiga brevicollis MX1]|eukprot:XP_001743242.1 hypothetical protein [Monosiga brevicollis MX1]
MKLELMSVTTLVLLLAVAVVVPATASLDHLPRGAAPKDAPHFAGDAFACDNGKSIPMESVNDEFCDCDDGSDEPGTSACANGHFYCTNEGHEPALMVSGRVNDGLCDCCDGSDEYSGLVACPNTCEELGRAAREAAEREAQLQREGFATRVRLENQAKQEIQVSVIQPSCCYFFRVFLAHSRVVPSQAKHHMERKERIAALDKEMESLERRVQELEAAKTEAETPEAAAKEVFDKDWEATMQARRSEAHANTFDFLDVNNDQSLTAEELLLHPELANDEQQGVTMKDIEALLDVDDDGSLSEAEQSVSLDHFKEHLYSHITKVMADKDGVHPEPSDPKPEYDEDIKTLIANADAARTAHREAESQKRLKESDRKKLENELNYDTGDSHEFAHMINQCYELEDREYKYKLCMFDKVTQEPKAGGRATKLGKWNGFVEGSDRTRAKFDDGEKCWNGPNRSCEVQLSCGAENKVLDVAEPNRCEYVMRMESPAVCKPFLAIDPAAHDEL